MNAYFDALNRRARETLRGLRGERRGRSSAVANDGGMRGAPARPEGRSVRRLVPGEVRSEYGGLRERLQIAANGQPLRMLVFAGCEGGEGCTEVAREFAETLASSGLNVLLIDADLRTSGLTASLGVEGPDVTELVQTGVSLPATSWGKGRLTVVPSRGMPVDQERFLRGAAFASWLDAHRSRYDYILLDAPPLLRFADGTLISRLCDGMIIVVRAEATKREALTRAREQLARAEANIVGVVLNGVRNPVPPFLRPYLTVE